MNAKHLEFSEWIYTDNRESKHILSNFFGEKGKVKPTENKTKISLKI